MRPRRTRVGNTDANVSVEEALFIQRKSLLQIILSGEFGISKAFRTHFSSVLNNTDADNAATGARKEVGHSLLVRIVGEIAEVGSIRRLVGKRELLALLTRIACQKLLGHRPKQVAVCPALPA